MASEHDITYESVWQDNGSVGSEVKCRTCDRVLWASPPDGSFDYEDGRRAAEAHQKEARAAAARKARARDDQD